MLPDKAGLRILVQLTQPKIFMNKRKYSTLPVRKKGQHNVHSKLLIESASQLRLHSRQKYVAALEILTRLQQNPDDLSYEKDLAEAKKLNREGDRLLKQARMKFNALKNQSNFLNQ